VEDGRLCAVLEAPTVVAGLDDVAMMGQPIEHGGCHLGVAEHLRPIGEGQIGGDQQRRVLIKFADQVEQQPSAGLTEWQIAEFVDDEIVAQQLLGQPAAATGGLLLALPFLALLSASTVAALGLKYEDEGVEIAIGDSNMLYVDKVAGPCKDECCAPPPLILPSKPAVDRNPLVREAFRLEWITIGWMVIEAVVAIGSGIVAGSLVLLAFGLDSVIELISAGVLMWRLSVELRHGHVFSEDAERIAGRIGGALLFTLGAYVVAAAGWNLWTQHHGEFSTPGFIVTLLAIPIMRYLATRKIDLANRLGSRALRTDAVESITCGWLSVVAVVSLGAQAIFGAWWIDSVGSLAILWFLIKEGREAWQGECCADCK